MHLFLYIGIYEIFLFQNPTKSAPETSRNEPQPSKSGEATLVQWSLRDRRKEVIYKDSDDEFSDVSYAMEEGNTISSSEDEFEKSDDYRVYHLAEEQVEEEEEEKQVEEGSEGLELPDLEDDRAMIFKAKSGHLWSNEEISASRTRSRNVVTETAKLNGAAAAASTILERFEAYMQTKVLEHIVEKTNKYAEELIAEKRDIVDKDVYQKTDIIELRAFIGILLAMGIYNDTKQDLSRLWNEESGRAIYRAGMSKRRFRALLTLIRFDDRNARKERERAGQASLDKLEHLRDVFDMINGILKENYTPGPYLCIDEMLCLYRGNATFRVYIKSKPGKYGLLLRMLSDCKTKIILQLAPYAGPQGNTPSKKPGEIVMDLARPYYNTNRNITTDRYYTSVDLATKLYHEHLTLVGTMNNSRMHLPENLKIAKGRQLNSTIFAMSHQPTSGENIPIMLASYVTKEKPAKNVILLSTMHTKFTVLDTYNGRPNIKKRPEVVEFYNSTMGAVDTDDQMVRRCSCRRATLRWPLSWFFSIIDICALNAFIIHGMKDDTAIQALKKRKHGVRMAFYEKLAFELIRPQSLKRFQTHTRLNFNIKESITNCFPEIKSQPPQIQPDQEGIRKRCILCYKEKVEKTPRVANVCKIGSNFCCKWH